MRIFLITLERNNKTRILYYKDIEYFKKINVFYGIDGKNLNKNNVLSVSNNIIPNNVIGCSLSHILLWKEIYDEGHRSTDQSEDHEVPQKFINIYDKYDINIILEDDTFFNENKLFFVYPQLLELFEREDTGLVFLYTDYVIFDKKHKHFNKNNTFNPIKFHLSNGSYAFKTSTIKKYYDIFKKDKINYHIDMELNHKTKKLKLTNYAIYPKDIKVAEQFESKSISSMNQNNEKFLSKINKNLYYNMKVPIIKINNSINLNGFLIFLISFFTLVIILNLFCYSNKASPYFIILYILIGILAWDIL